MTVDKIKPIVASRFFKPFHTGINLGNMMFEIITSSYANSSEQLSSNPLEWGFALWLVIFIMTLPGGIANCINRIKQDGLTWSWRGVLELFKDVLWSGSIGPIAFMLVMRQTDELIYGLSACAISAHVAPRLIFGGNAIVEIGTNKYLKKIDPNAKPHQLTDEELNAIIESAINKAKETQ